MDPEVHRGRNGAAGENRVRKLGSVLTLDIFQKGQATRSLRDRHGKFNFVAMTESLHSHNSKYMGVALGSPPQSSGEDAQVETA